VLCHCVSDGGVVHDHVGNMVVTAAGETSPPLTDSMMQVSCTDSDKSPTESSYDLPTDLSNSLPTVRLAVCLAHSLSVLLKRDLNHFRCSGSCCAIK